MKLRWINTGRFYKCYNDDDGAVLGAVRENDEADGTYVALVRGHFIGEYINQEAATIAVAKMLNTVYVPTGG
jgi:hypothetical protein